MRRECEDGRVVAPGSGVPDGYRILDLSGCPHHGHPRSGRPPRLRTAHRRRAGRGDRRAPSLARLLRTLVALGLCERADAGGVYLTPLGEAMHSNVPDSARSFVLFITAPWVERGWEDLPQAVRTGEPTFPRVHGVGFWDYLGAHPEEGALFDAAMSGGASARAEALRAARELSSIGTVVDVGGGQGRLLATLLKAVPGLRGVLLDRPEVVAGAEAMLQAEGVADRCVVAEGDFFAALPQGGDAYILAQIVHDWPDAEELAILSAC